MCQYMLIIPTLTDVLRRIGVSTGLVGAIAGASDFASMFMTPGSLGFSSQPFPACVYSCALHYELEISCTSVYCISVGNPVSGLCLLL